MFGLVGSHPLAIKLGIVNDRFDDYYFCVDAPIPLLYATNET